MGAGVGLASASARRAVDRTIDRAAKFIRNCFADDFGERLRRLADQIGLGDLMEQGAQRADAALFGPAAEDPIDIVEAQQRLFRRIGVGRLGIVDVEDFAAAADLLHPVRETGESLQALLDELKLEIHAGRAPPPPRRRSGHYACRAARECRRDRRSDSSGAVGLADEPRAFENDAVRNRRMMDRDRHDGPALRAQLLGDAGADVVIDTDDGDIGLGDEPFLDLGIMFHRPMPVEMIGRDIEKHAEGRIERGRKIDLERRAFDHMDAPCRDGGLSARTGVPILPPTSTS